MKHLISILLFGLFLVGCASAPPHPGDKLPNKVTISGSSVDEIQALITNGYLERNDSWIIENQTQHQLKLTRISDNVLANALLGCSACPPPKSVTTYSFSKQNAEITVYIQNVLITTNGFGAQTTTVNKNPANAKFFLHSIEAKLEGDVRGIKEDIN